MLVNLKNKLSPIQYTPWVLYTAVGTGLSNLLLIVTGAVVRLTGYPCRRYPWAR